MNQNQLNNIPTSCSVEQQAFARTLFVLAKHGRIRCLSPDEMRSGENEWKAQGWRHTATIDPARWIEAMANGNTDPSDMLDELQMGLKADLAESDPTPRQCHTPSIAALRKDQH